MDQARNGFRRHVRAAGWIVLLLLGSIRCTFVRGATRPSPEDAEAAYLYNFGKFVRWPPAASSGPIQICVAGSESLHETVSHLVAGESISGRTIQSRIVESREAIRGCSILFIGTAQRGGMEAWLSAAADEPVLTVSDAPNFVDNGGMIQFVLLGDHVRFAVNLAAADRSGLALSSELLKVAVHVTGNPSPGKRGAP